MGKTKIEWVTNAYGSLDALSPGETITHTYPNFGSYTVALTVRDAAGNTDELIRLIALVPPRDV